MDEVDPLSVKLYRRVSTVEYSRTEYQAVKEIRHERTTYNCRNVYDRYISFMLTTLAVPMLYEVATGFDILKGMCEKNSQNYFTETAATDKIISKESFDKEKIVTKEIPIAGETVTLEINRNKFIALTSPTGIASFPEKDLASLYDSEKNSSIDYLYNDIRLAAPFKKREQKKEPEPALSSSKAYTVNQAAAGSASSDNTQSNVNISALSQSKPDSTPMQPGQSAANTATIITDSQVVTDTEPKLNVPAKEISANKSGEEAETVKIVAIASKEKSGLMDKAAGQNTTPDPAQEKTQQDKENQPPKLIKLARKLNKSKQSFLNENESLKIIQQDKSIRILNKSNLAMTIRQVSVHYNGRVIENLLSAPVVILPKATSTELNKNNTIGEEFDDFERFGIAVSYQIRSADPVKSLSKVNRYTDDKVSEEPEASAQLNAAVTGMPVKATAAADIASVSIGAASSSGTPSPEGWKIVLNIKFDTNKATIKNEYYPRLKEIGEALKVNPGLRGVIEGHTDNVGSKEVNQKISVRRAEAVAQHLIKNFGIASDRIRIEGFGLSRPVADNSTPDGRATNRRIEAKFKDAN